MKDKELSTGVSSGRRKVVPRVILSVLIITLVGGGSWWFMAGRAMNSATSVTWRTEPVTRATLERTISCTGTLAAVGTVVVGTQVSGALREVRADFNDRVRKGQVLAVLDQSLYNASVESADAAVQKAQVELTQAEADLVRNGPLRARGFLSVKEFLSFETAAAAARATLRSAEAALQKARTDLGHTVITSPIDGTVIERSVEAGQTVAASLSAPTLFIIAEDLSRMQIKADVDENDIGVVKTGQEARFTVPAHPEVTFAGTVAEIRLNPIVVSNVVTYTVVVDAANRGGLLLPGMTATVDFVVERVDNALTVPNAALSFTPADAVKAVGSGVWVPGASGQPTRVAVQAGMTDAARTEVLNAHGLAEGTLVVTGIAAGNATTQKNGNLFSSLMPGPPKGKPAAPPQQ